MKKSTYILEAQNRHLIWLINEDKTTFFSFTNKESAFMYINKLIKNEDITFTHAYDLLKLLMAVKLPDLDPKIKYHKSYIREKEYKFYYDFFVKILECKVLSQNYSFPFFVMYILDSKFMGKIYYFNNDGKIDSSPYINYKNDGYAWLNEKYRSKEIPEEYVLMLKSEVTKALIPQTKEQALACLN